MIGKSYFKYWILVSFNHVGDYNQALQVKNHYLWQKNDLGVTIQIKDIENQALEVDLEEAEIIHTIGEKAMIKFSKFRQNNPAKDLLLIVQIHQHFALLNQLHPNLLIIPEASYVNTPALQDVSKFLVEGTIFQKLSDQKLEELYQGSAQIKQISPQQKYLILVLSGDAPDEQKMKFFAKQDAQRLAYIVRQFIQKQQEKPILIIQNGPRTGKHDPQTGKQICLHKYNKGCNPEDAIDLVSQHFVSTIKKLGVQHRFYNFAFQIDEASRKVISYYKPLMYLAKKQQNIFFFPMESVSMCSELPYYIKPQNLFAYFTASANENHLKIVQKFHGKGLFRKIDQKGQISELPKFQGTKFDQTSTIISFICGQIKQKQQLKVEQSL